MTESEKQCNREISRELIEHHIGGIKRGNVGGASVEKPDRPLRK